MPWGFNMFGKLSLAMLLMSVSCFAQVSTTGGYATSAQSSMAGAVISSDNPPLVSTPDIALPGSGSAVGAPLSSAAANDSRFSTGPSVHSANAIAPQASGDNGTLAFGLPANESVQTSGSSPGAQNFEFGIQHFESGLPNANTSVPSLGQIARNYRAQHRKPARSFNNDSISQLNSAGVRTGNLGPESSTTVASSTQPSAQSASSGTLMAQNQPPVLPQSDQDQTTPAGQSVRPSAPASQQRHRVETPNLAAAQNSAAAIHDSTSGQNAAKNGSAKLPQTASSLPLFFLIGGLGIAGGALYLLRR
jgi:LPXTG-motif cell wall-anchored protein